MPKQKKVFQVTKFKKIKYKEIHPNKLTQQKNNFKAKII